MKVILFSRLCHKSGSTAFSLPRLGLCLSLLVPGLLVAAGFAGYQLGQQSVQQAAPVTHISTLVSGALEQQRQEIRETRRETRVHLDALALRLGTLQSELMRLDALGEELIRIGDLDAAEFNLAETPALGGAQSPEDLRSVELAELLADMDRLSQSIEDRAHKLRLLEEVLVGGEIGDELKPAGRPVKKGWISSRYGYRKDPFTGKKAFHHGVDIAGKSGAGVFAVASGVVTDAGEKNGYGYLVELTHADGLVTRYAHNKEIYVGIGDLVNKGDKIGSMGSTGRSTGPHVHFEIVRNGKSLNPAKYLRKG